MTPISREEVSRAISCALLSSSSVDMTRSTAARRIAESWRLRTFGARQLYCCSICACRTQPVEIIAADTVRSAVYAIVGTPVHKTIFLFYYDLRLRRSTRAPRRDLAPGVHNTRIPPSCVSCSAYSRKKRRLSQPLSQPMSCARQPTRTQALVHEKKNLTLL